MSSLEKIKYLKSVCFVSAIDRLLESKDIHTSSIAKLFAEYRILVDELHLHSSELLTKYPWIVKRMKAHDDLLNLLSTEYIEAMVYLHENHNINLQKKINHAKNNYTSVAKPEILKDSRND